MKREISYNHRFYTDPEFFNNPRAEGTLIGVIFENINYKCYERRNGRRSRNFNYVSEIEAVEALRHPSVGRRTRSFCYSPTVIDSTVSTFLTRIGVPYAEQRPMVDGIKSAFKEYGWFCFPVLYVAIQTVEVIEVGDPVPSRPCPPMRRNSRDDIENKKLEALGILVSTIMERLETVNEEPSDVVCAICLEEVVASTENRVLPCCHMYHGECLLEWLRKNQDCPLCRSSLLLLHT